MFSACVNYAKRGYESACAVTAAAQETATTVAWKALAVTRKVTQLVSDPRKALAEGREKVVETALKVKAFMAHFGRRQLPLRTEFVEHGLAKCVAFISCYHLTNKVQDSFGTVATTALVVYTLILPTFVYRVCTTRLRYNDLAREVAMKGMQGALIAASPACALVSVPLLTSIALQPTQRRYAARVGLGDRVFYTDSTRGCIGSAASALLLYGCQEYLQSHPATACVATLATAFRGWVELIPGMFYGLRSKDTDMILMDGSAALLKGPQSVKITEPPQALHAMKLNVHILDAGYERYVMRRRFAELAYQQLAISQARYERVKSCLEKHAKTSGEPFPRDLMPLIMAYEPVPAYRLVIQKARSLS